MPSPNSPSALELPHNYAYLGSYSLDEALRLTFSKGGYPKANAGKKAGGDQAEGYRISETHGKQYEMPCWCKVPGGYLCSSCRRKATSRQAMG